MFGCSVCIVTQTEGTVRTFETNGVLTRQFGTVTVRYTEEGDRVTLQLSGEEMQMRREGTGVIAARFLEGGETALLLELGAERASVPVRTSVYRFLKEGKAYCAVLCYTICYPQAEQEFVLKIVIDRISEEK